MPRQGPGMPPSAAWKARLWGVWWILLDFVTLFHFFRWKSAANLFQRIYYCSLGWSDALMQWHVHAACNLCEKDTYFNLVLWNFQRPLLQRETSKNDVSTVVGNIPQLPRNKLSTFFVSAFGLRTFWMFRKPYAAVNRNLGGENLSGFSGVVSVSPAEEQDFFIWIFQGHLPCQLIDLANWECYESYDLSPSQQVSEFLLQKLDAYEIQNNLTCKLHYQ